MPESQQSLGDAPRPRELRLGLVLNGGVSLAVWIGGVIHEIDRLRRAAAGSEAETALYRGALSERGYTDVRIDVIAGASAGGINGALLAAAIQGGTEAQPLKPLRGAQGQSLRDVWAGLADLRQMTRKRDDPDASSLLCDATLVDQLHEILDSLLVPAEMSALPLVEGPRRSVHLYLTATDLSGTSQAKFSTSADVIAETDHRIVFSFSANDPDGEPVVPSGELEPEHLADQLALDRSNAYRLTLAARASSSFPIAFSPLSRPVRRGTGRRASALIDMVDGGILDNQPIDPVLNRISLMPVEGPWRRVVCYVVPYVTKESEASEASKAKRPPAILDVARSGGLAGDLPKLQSLQRMETDRRRAADAGQTFLALRRDAEGALSAAPALMHVYREVQARQLLGTFASWVANPDDIGDTTTGGSEVVSPEERAALVPVGTTGVPASLEPLLPPATFSEASKAWSSPDGTWTWGLSKARRFARTALEWARSASELGDCPEDLIVPVRLGASSVARRTQLAVRARRTVFAELLQSTTDYGERFDAFVESYHRIPTETAAVAEAMRALSASLAAMLTGSERPGAPGPGSPLTPEDAFARLASVEVVRHAAGMREPDPPQFDFFRFSARTPEPFSGPTEKLTAPADKLAGMGLMHFAGFLRRSWRVNDWMYGRLDGAHWIAEMLYSDAKEQPDEPAAAAARDELRRALHREILLEELPHLHAAARDDREGGFSPTPRAGAAGDAESTIAAIGTRSTELSDAVLSAALDTYRLGAGSASAEIETRAGAKTVAGLVAAACRTVRAASESLPAVVGTPVRALLGKGRIASITARATLRAAPSVRRAAPLWGRINRDPPAIAIIKRQHGGHPAPPPTDACVVLSAP